MKGSADSGVLAARSEPHAAAVARAAAQALLGWPSMNWKERLLLIAVAGGNDGAARHGLQRDRHQRRRGQRRQRQRGSTISTPACNVGGDSCTAGSGGFGGTTIPSCNSSPDCTSVGGSTLGTSSGGSSPGVGGFGGFGGTDGGGRRRRRAAEQRLLRGPYHHEATK